MKTLTGHYAAQGLPNLGNLHPPFFQALEKDGLRFSKPWKTAAAKFLPLRQPLGGHGNFRKEHRAA